MNKAAAALVGITFFSLLVLSLLWSVFGGFIKAYTPNELGYSELGWVRTGHQTVFHIGVPKWAGWAGFLSAVQASSRHYKINLRQGQKIVVDYDIHIERGRMRVAAFRTNLSAILQGARVDDYKYQFFRPGRHVGTFEYVAPADGIYRFDYEVLWDRKSNLPDYEVVYDFRWRLERD